MRTPIYFVMSLLVLVTLACGFNVSTANIKEAKLAKDPDGKLPTTTFGQDETFYLVAEVANAPDDTTVKAVWTATEADGVEPDRQNADQDTVCALPKSACGCILISESRS